MRYSLGTEDAARISETHVAVERWVYDPTEENRRAAQAVADKEGSDSPSALLAMAAFYSGGSIGPPQFEPVAPPDHVTPQFVAGAIMIAAVESEPAKVPEKYRGFLQRGMALMAKMPAGKSSGAWSVLRGGLLCVPNQRQPTADRGQLTRVLSKYL